MKNYKITFTDENGKIRTIELEAGNLMHADSIARTYVIGLESYKVEEL